MARYVVERDFPEGLSIPVTAAGAEACLEVTDNNAVEGVTWVHSYVTTDKRKTFCVYDAPSVQAIQRAAGLNGLPVNHISEVRVLDPYFYV